MVIAHLSEDEVRRLQESAERLPRTRKLNELIVRHAEAAGGRTLTVWQELMGVLWGLPVMMSADVAASRLGMPVEDVVKIHDDTIAAIRQEWETSAEYHGRPGV